MSSPIDNSIHEKDVLKTIESLYDVSNLSKFISFYNYMM